MSIIYIMNNNIEINIKVGKVRFENVFYNDSQYYDLYIEDDYGKEIRWMTYNPKTKSEHYEQYMAYDIASGRCVLSGLGYGILCNWIVNKPEVESVTVYELSKDVIELNNIFNNVDKRVKIINDSIHNANEKNIDCLLLDHYEFHSDTFVINDVKYLSKKINPTKTWFWSYETLLIRHLIKKHKLKKILEESSIELSYSENEFMLDYHDWIKSNQIENLIQFSFEDIKKYMQCYKHMFQTE